MLTRAAGLPILPIVMRGRGWFLLVAGILTVAHPMLPAGVAAVTYVLVSAITLLPLTGLLRRTPAADRTPWSLLTLAMTLLTVANALPVIGGDALQLPSELLMTAGHTAMLIAAVTLVLRRGRNDIGGLLDVSVAAIGLGGLLWTALVFPRLLALHTTVGEQVALLVSVLVLSGVLGALIRVRVVSDKPLRPVALLIAALLTALIGNVVLAMTTGSMTTGRPGWIELFFLVAYMCVGSVAFDPAIGELMRPGPAPADRLSTGRLVFLGAALVVGPVAGGVRDLAGLPADGPLLALGALLVAPLVMIRVGRLAGERTAAVAALTHQATHDRLTGLPNRGALLDRLTAALAAERAAGRARVVLLFCDLNGFKPVNDRLGHLAGDRLLTEVGARIGAGLRAGDTLARYGGDEFLVLCADDDQRAAADRLTRHVAAVLAEPFDLGEPVHIGVATGVALSDGTLGPDELINRADQAMYESKQWARGRA